MSKSIKSVVTTAILTTPGGLTVRDLVDACELAAVKSKDLVKSVNAAARKVPGVVVATDDGGATVYRHPDAAAPEEQAAPCAPCTPAPEDTPKAPKARKRSRVDVTLEMLRRDGGTTVAELAAAFEAEFGDGKVSTATQAIHKVPKAKAGTKATNTGAVEGREGSVYTLPPATD